MSRRQVNFINNNINNYLLSVAEDDYRKFSASLIPNIDNVLGVRLPVLRKIAKEIYVSGSWHDFLKQTNSEFMEEIMLQGMVIGLIKESPEKILNYVKDFIPKINNWSVCDSFCTGLKFTKENKKLVWRFIQPYFKSDKEFEIRYAYVMLLMYFVEKDYIEKILKLIDNFKDKRYYTQMAAAWALSVCYIKFPNITYDYLKNSNLDSRTFNKSIQKITESLKVPKSEKEKLKKLKKTHV